MPESPAQSDVVDLAIIGGGPVGLFAAFYAGLRQMSVKIIDSLEELGGQLVTLYPEKYIYDVAGFPKILAKDLARDLIAQGMQYSATPCLGEQVLTVVDHPEGGFVLTTNKAVHRARTVVISAGVGAFQPKKLPLANEAEFHGKGLHYFVKGLDVFRGKRVLVVGGGDSAVDWANMLHPLAAKVTLIHRRDGFRAHEDSVVKLKQSPVDIKVFYELRAIAGDTTGIRAATIYDNRTNQDEALDVDAVLVNIGFNNALGPIKEWGLELEKNAIKVDSTMRTNRAGIFAAGDICTYVGKLKLIATGFGEAAIAVNFAKTFIDPKAKAFPGHSSDMDVPAGH
jgi:ferredoxin/flavodoxin---NADP+ reductase